ncbi:hypothetical protein GCM10027514_33030 [Azotobacter armeniacus]
MEGLEWGEGYRYRPLGRQALATIIEGRLAEAVDCWLDALGVDTQPDRRNGHYRRHLLTELGAIELAVPRTRRYCPSEVLHAYGRRSAEIDRAILAGFVLGLSTRKLGEVLLVLLGRPVSASTLSAVAKTLDGAVAAFHARSLKTHYRVGNLPHRSLPPRALRRGPRDDLRRRRRRPAGRSAGGLSRPPRAALLGAQDPQCPR